MKVNNIRSIFENINQAVDLEIFEQLEDEKSSTNHFLEEMYINLAVNNLKDNDVPKFFDLMNNDNENEARSYLLAKLPDFDEQLRLTITESLQELKEYARN